MMDCPPPEIHNRLERLGQLHAIRFWERLAAPERAELVKQIDSLDLELATRLAREHLASPPDSPAAAQRFEPAKVVPLAHDETGFQRDAHAADRGRQLLARGEIAAFLVAGGQGTRLGFDGPKGCFPIGPVSGKTLFQLLFERILALGAKAGRAAPLYVMTSEENHEATSSFLIEHAYFGLNPADVTLLKQGMLPAVDERGRVLLESPSRIHTAPDGHGGALRALSKSGALSDMRRRGITQVFTFQVDNVLARVLDPVFIGLHGLAGADMSTKVVRKTQPAERVGVLGLVDGVEGVIEYSELGDERARQRNIDGGLRFWAGNAAIHMLAVDFIERLTADPSRALPFHMAHKACPVVDDAGDTRVPNRPNAYKFENFLFDALGFARVTVAQEIARVDEFSPVKNERGADSPETAREHLAAQARRWCDKAGIDAPRTREISPLFALDADEFQRKAKTLKNPPEYLA